MILLIMALPHWFCFFVLGEINAQIECRRAARAPRSGSLTELPSDCRAPYFALFASLRLFARQLPLSPAVS
jgi:hypothetical protein